jgi:hypothetical protein
MKKALLLTLFTLFAIQPINAQLRFDPALNIFYSHPRHPSINEIEYVGLFATFIELWNRIEAANAGRIVPDKEILEQCVAWLKSVGTPTALRLIEDLEDNAIYYENGTFMRKLY